MNVSQYRKVSFALLNGSSKRIYILMAFFMIIFCFFPAAALLFSDNDNIDYLMIFSFFAFEMYATVNWFISERCPVFGGTSKPKGETGFAFEQNKVLLYQLPVSRETIVRTYIGLDRIFGGAVFLMFILQGAVLMLRPESVSFETFLFVFQLFISASVIALACFLRRSDPKKTAAVRKAMIYSPLLAIAFGGALEKICEKLVLRNTFLSEALGAVSVLLGIICMFIMNSIYRGMISDCAERSVSGELITSKVNDENVKAALIKDKALVLPAESGAKLSHGRFSKAMRSCSFSFRGTAVLAALSLLPSMYMIFGTRADLMLTLICCSIFAAYMMTSFYLAQMFPVSGPAPSVPKTMKWAKNNRTAFNGSFSLYDMTCLFPTTRKKLASSLFAGQIILLSVLWLLLDTALLCNYTGEMRTGITLFSLCLGLNAAAVPNSQHYKPSRNYTGAALIIISAVLLLIFAVCLNEQTYLWFPAPVAAAIPLAAIIYNAVFYFKTAFIGNFARNGEKIN